MGPLTDTQKAQVVALRESGMTIRGITKETQISHTSVKKYIKEDQKAELMKESGFSRKVSLLKKKFNDSVFLKANQLMSGITAEKIEKGNVLQLATSFGILVDKHRLLTNQSTENHSIIGGFTLSTMKSMGDHS